MGPKSQERTAVLLIPACRVAAVRSVWKSVTAVCP